MKKISIKDIARKAGASITTVSIVLNGNGPDRKISEKMINKIQKVSEELNYRPNQFAKSLRTGKTNTIGLIVDDISNFFFGNLAKVVEEEANGLGYTVMFCSSQNDEGKTRNVLGSLIEKNMDGYIIAPTLSMVSELRELKRDNKPFVLIDRFFSDLESSYVTIDNYKGSFDSVSYLAKQGYKKIAIVTSDTEQIQMQERLEGYKAALRKYGMPFIPMLVKKIPFKYSVQKIVNEVWSFVEKNPEVDSILFTSNNLGIPGLEGLRKARRFVGSDIGIICFDDHDLFRLASPAITVVSQPIRAIGKNVLRILVDNINTKETKTTQVVLDPKLIVRDSTPLKK